MASSTIVILPCLEGGEAIVAVMSNDGYQVSRVSSDALSQQTLSDVQVILPGQLVRIFETDLPKAGQAQQLKMARFAREDDIASSSDNLHFALSDAQPPRLAVVDKIVMERLLGVIGTLRPKGVYADYDLLTGDKAVNVIDRAVEPAQAALDLNWIDATLDQPSDTALVERFAEGLTAGRGLNLLQGAYRARSRLDLPRYALGRFGALAAASLIGLFIWTSVKNGAALDQAEALRAETAAEYLDATGERAPSNPGRETAKAIQSGPQIQAGFLDLSSVLFSGLSGLNDMRVDQLRFNASDRTLRLRLIYPSFDAATRAEAAIAQAGGVLVTGGVREQDGVFVGDATLSLGGQS